MGHHLFFNEEKKAIAVRDSDVALLKHFLHEGATRIGDAGLAASVSKWEYQGPGVWIGVEERFLSDQERAFEVAAEVARELGDSIPADYLNKKAALTRATWLKEMPTSLVLDRLNELRHHLSKNA
jgi:hypothetical protein